MKAAAFDYVRPTSVAAAVKLLTASGGGAKVIAGGQSLGPMLNLRLVQPEQLVDIGKIRELGAVRPTAGGFIVGSCVTHAELEDGKTPDFTHGLMTKVAAGIAYRAIRNRGTIGGSVCHADPAADWVIALTLLSAVALIEGPEGPAEIDLHDFVTGPFSTQLGPAQILTGLRIPALSPQARWSYCKICRKPGEFADAIGALLHDDRSGLCRAVVGTPHGAPCVIEDARFATGKYDPGHARAALAAAGVAPDTYEMQIRGVALKRAAAQMAMA